jgi:hypothetical protein
VRVRIAAQITGVVIRHLFACAVIQADVARQLLDELAECTISTS